MSSRNARLTPEGRAAAPVLRRALLTGAGAIRDGETDAEAVRRAMRDVLATEPAAGTDYVSVADTDTLAELVTVRGDALLSLAVRIDGVRLIDNERAAPPDAPG
jgi:pantoate--beta-alanine ligase